MLVERSFTIFSLDDYVICNYYFNSEDGETILDEELDRPRKFNQLSLALDYWFETQPPRKNIRL